VLFRFFRAGGRLGFLAGGTEIRSYGGAFGGAEDLVGVELGAGFAEDVLSRGAVLSGGIEERLREGPWGG